MNNAKFPLTPVAAAFLAALALPAHAEDVYKWRDAQGQVNYSNVPSRAEARVAAPVEDQISVIHPVDIKPAARAAAERNFAARLSQQQALAVQPMEPPPAIPADGYLPPDVVGGHVTGAAANKAYSRALNRYYRRSLKPTTDSQATANAPSQAANMQRAQAAESAQAQAANNPQQSATAREAARVNANRNAGLGAGGTGSRTASGTIGGR